MMNLVYIATNAACDALCVAQTESEARNLARVYGARRIFVALRDTGRDRYRKNSRRLIASACKELLAPV